MAPLGIPKILSIMMCIVRHYTETLQIISVWSTVMIFNPSLLCYFCFLTNAHPIINYNYMKVLVGKVFCICILIHLSSNPMKQLVIFALPHFKDRTPVIKL